MTDASTSPIQPYRYYVQIQPVNGGFIVLYRKPWYLDWRTLKNADNQVAVLNGNEALNICDKLRFLI